MDAAAWIGTSDLYDRHGEALGVLGVGLVSLGARTRFAGPAVTVKCFEDNSRIMELVESPGDGRVMVIDGGGSPRTALVGDRLAGAAAANGWAGMVVWGMARDRAALAGIDLGVMALGTTPRRPLRHGDGRIGEVLHLPAMRVVPGDRIVADEDGIVAIPRDEPDD